MSFHVSPGTMKRHYVLDGNNIIKGTPEFMELAGGNFVKAQHELVLRTAKVLLKNADSAVVFFDGFGLNYRFRPPPRTRVTFSKEKSADQLIVEEIKKYRSPYIEKGIHAEAIAVSDDREIREGVRIFGGIPWGIREFVERLFPDSEKKEHREKKEPEKAIPLHHRQGITRELEKHYGIEEISRRYNKNGKGD